MADFSKVIDRLYVAVRVKHRGCQTGNVLVSREDLHALIVEWVRLDNLARQQHEELQKFVNLAKGNEVRDDG